MEKFEWMNSDVISYMPTYLENTDFIWPKREIVCLDNSSTECVSLISTLVEPKLCHNNIICDSQHRVKNLKHTKAEAKNIFGHNNACIAIIFTNDLQFQKWLLILM
jgi:hypothetical protein